MKANPGIQRNEDGELKVYVNDSEATQVNDYIAGGQSGSVFVAGEAGKKIDLHSVYVSSNATTGNMTLNEETSGTVVFRRYFSAQKAASSSRLHIELAENKDLLITCPDDTFVAVTYHLESV